MKANDSSSESQPVDPRRGRRVAAAVLLTVGGFALLTPHLPWLGRGGILLPMGVAFLIWAALARVAGLAVPGGILTGLGVGLMLQPQFGAAALLFGLSGGFLVVAAVNWLLFAPRCAWWPLWPAAGLAIAGLATLQGAEFREVRQVMREFWPYAAIAVALWLFIVPGRKSD